MSGFNLGTGNTTAQPGGLFGSNSNTTTTGSLFGAPATQTSSLTFGAPTQSTPLQFGATPTLSFGTTPVLSFGATSQASTALPSFGTSTPQTNTGLSFGTPASTTTTGLFGATTQASGLSLGQPATLSFGATPAQSNLSFGAAPAQTSLSFGTTPAQSNLSFGTAPAQSNLSFGAAPAQSNLSFGAAPAQSNLSFGATPTQPALSFGGLSTTTSSGLSFGTSTAAVAPLGSMPGLGFAAPNVTAPGTGLGFGATTSAAPSLSFGAPTTSSLGFPGGLTSTVGKPALSFGATSTSSGGLSFSLPTSTGNPSTGLFGSLGAKPSLGLATTSTATALSFGGVSTVTPTTSIGLGGIDLSQSKTGVVGLGAGRMDTKAVKENQIPNEILQTIDGFKSFVKVQKGLSSDIARGSIKPLDKVREDTESLNLMLSKITSSLQKYRSQADHLKAETAMAIRNAEMAQRTHDTPPGLQYDNTAPLHYFTDLVASFEQEMQSFRQEIENTEKHIKSLTEPRPLTSQELGLAMRRLHDSFIALAGRLQTVHNSVESQKDQYSNLRKYFLKDTSNVFGVSKKPVNVVGRPIMANRISLGPTPFSPMGNQHGYSMMKMGPSDTSSSFTTGNALLGWGGMQPQSNSFMSNSASNVLSMGLNPAENQSFLLQKPPPGTKRGKR